MHIIFSANGYLSNIFNDEKKLKSLMEKEKKEKIEKKKKSEEKSTSSTTALNNNEDDDNLVMVLYDKDEYIVITDWKVKDGWISSYKKDKPTENGIFPLALIKKCSTNNNEDNPTNSEFYY